MIYLIINDKELALKIGYSKHPEKRLKQLQTSNHNKLAIAQVFGGTIEEEKAFHREFKECNIGNEWFDIRSQRIWWFFHYSQNISYETYKKMYPNNCSVSTYVRHLETMQREEEFRKSENLRNKLSPYIIKSANQEFPF